MSQCVPDWDKDRCGGCSPGIPESTGDLVPLDECHAHNDPFTDGTADDVWSWWDWELDDVAELKWADGQPRVLPQTGAATSKTPTPTPAALLTPPMPPPDAAAADDLDLERWLCADAIVPGSTGRGPAAATDSTGCCLLVPDATTAPAASSITLGGAPRKRPPQTRAGEGVGREEQIKRHRAHVDKDTQVPWTLEQGGEERRRHDDNPAGICSASPPNKARCRSALSERKRRDKFNQKIRTLQKLLPNCAKVDKVSILDEVIIHVRQLQAQAQMHMITNAAAASSAALPSISQPPIMMPAPSPATPMAAYMHHQFQIMAQMAAQMSQMLRNMGLAGANSFFPHPPPPSHLINLISSFQPTLIPVATPAEQPAMAPSGSSSSRSTQQGFAASFAQPRTK